MEYWTKLNRVSRMLQDKTSKIIGWGTSSYFEYYIDKITLRLDYLVDNDSSKWGTFIHGIEVLPPEFIQNENLNPLIVIFSSFSSEIIEQIERMGDYATCTASQVNDFEITDKKGEKINRITSIAQFKKKPQSKNAIIIQGPVIPEITKQVTQYYAAQYPNDWIILSTWEETDEVELALIKPYVDQIVLNQIPEIRGIQNRNLQILSTLNGIRAAYEKGINYILKTRTDAIVLTTNIFEKSKQKLDQYDNTVASSYGLKQRIIISQSFTRKYIAYHPADIVMLGTIDDMLRFWKVEHDLRDFDPKKMLIWNGWTLYTLSSEMYPAESYLAIQFAQAIGWELKFTLEDSWDFYKNIFLVLNNEYLELFWYKNPSLPDEHTEEQQRQLVDHEFWSRLYNNDQIQLDELLDIRTTLWIKK